MAEAKNIFQRKVVPVMNKVREELQKTVRPTSCATTYLLPVASWQEPLVPMAV